MHLSKAELKRLIKKNPDLKLPAELDSPAPAVPNEQSPLESKFLSLWTLLDGPDLVREYRFEPTRRWRVDFVHMKSRVMIEVEGIGRHNRIPGFRKDAEKYLTATLQGWTVIRLPSTLITPDWIKKIIEYVKE